jgi:flagellar biosynthesis protein FlhF
MIIKRYIVDNMNEAMVKIRYELGNDAVIVSQRKIKQGGFLGLFKARKLEVTAAADDRSKRAKESIESRDAVQNEILELKSMIKSLMSQKEENTFSSKKEGKSKIKQKLINNDIPEEIVEYLYEKIKQNNSNKKLTPKTYEKEIKNEIENLIMVDENRGGRIQVLIGPTGVGKTTTIAKLASLYTLYKNKKVGLITLDTYRIGAVEQLKTYAEILGVPFEVAISSKDIVSAVEKMGDCEIIFVDTTGRNSKNIMQVSETRKYIEEIKPDKVHLVLSMTTKEKDIKSIIENYRVVNYNSLILTKVDETDTLGSILTSLYYSKVPVAYICAGQNVPDDLEEAKKEQLIKLILGAEE